MMGPSPSRALPTSVASAIATSRSTSVVASMKYDSTDM